MRIVNLTGHPLSLVDDDGRNATVASAARARVSSLQVPDGEWEVGGLSIPILRIAERTVHELPEPEDGTLYVVSGLVAAVASRRDVVSPIRLVREPGGGRVLGARALLRAGDDLGSF